jgi:hypothetical protein
MREMGMRERGEREWWREEECVCSIVLIVTK